MDRALSLAWRGWGRVHPNPMVGAVVLQGGQAVGEGWHAEFGGPHAEVEALRAAGASARGGTLVVSLEPCAHHGKQPPCVEAIADAGIAQVVAACRDPHPVAAGGAAWLAERGIPVRFGPGAEAACRQNARFLHAASAPDRPWVAVKLAVSLDGRIADAAGRSRWISGAEARDFVHWLRGGFDAIAVGGATARADDPALTVRGSVVPRIPPRRVVFDRRLDLPGRLQLVEQARAVPTIAVGSPDAVEGPGVALAAAGLSVLAAATLDEGLRHLRELERVEALLVEGGGRLVAALLGEGLVDRVYLVQAPIWLGQGGVPAFPGLPDTLLGAATPWHVVERRALGQDTLLVVDRAPCSPAL